MKNRSFFRAFMFLAVLFAFISMTLLPNTAEAAVSALEPSAIYEAIEAGSLLPEMVAVEEDSINSTYGVALTDLDSFAAAEAKSSLKADTVVIMRAKNKAAAARIQKALDAELTDRLAAVKKTSTKYKVLELSTVRASGLYVYLVISQNASGIEAIIDDAILSGSVSASASSASGSSVSSTVPSAASALSGADTYGSTASDDGCVGDGLVW